jgi:hypothetical protein
VRACVALGVLLAVVLVAAVTVVGGAGAQTGLRPYDALMVSY